MSIGLDASVHNANQNSTSISLSLTTQFANEVIIAVVSINSATVASIQSAHLNFTLRKRQQASDGKQDYHEIWYAVAPSPLSAENITVTGNSGTNYLIVTIFGISGANTTTIFDSNSSLPAAVSSGNITLSTSNANDFIVGTYRFGSTFAPTAGTGWTEISEGDYQLVEYQIVSATQSNLNVTIGTGSGDENAGIGDAIMAAGPAPLALAALSGAAAMGRAAGAFAAVLSGRGAAAGGARAAATGTAALAARNTLMLTARGQPQATAPLAVVARNFAASLMRAMLGTPIAYRGAHMINDQMAVATVLDEQIAVATMINDRMGPT